MSGKFLIISLSVIHLLTYVIPVSIFVSIQQRYPRQLSESTHLVLESSGKEPMMLSYLLMIFFVISTFLILREIIQRKVDQFGVVPHSRNEVLLTIGIFIPIFFEFYRLLMGIGFDMFELLIFLILLSFVLFNIYYISLQTWKLKKVQTPISDISIFILSFSMSCYFMAAITNIETINLIGIPISKIHTIFAVMAYVSFYPLMFSIRSSSRLSLFFLYLSIVSIIGFNFIPQVTNSTSITPHLMFEFFGVGFLYCSLLTSEIIFPRSKLIDETE